MMDIYKKIIYLFGFRDTLKKIISFMYQKILGIISVFYYVHLPQGVRRLISPAIKKISLWVKSIFILLIQIRQESFIISGRCKGSSIRILYVGKKLRLPYILQLIHLDESEVKKGRKNYFWNIRQKFDYIQGNVDLFIVELNTLLASKAKKEGFLLIPEWVKFTLQVPDSIEKFIRGANKSLKEKIRKVRRNGYSYEISRDPERLKLFYYKMYTPYISQRFSYLPYIHNFYSVKRIFKTGAILFIKHNDEYIAGNVLAFRDKILRVRLVGIKDGDQKYLKKAVVSAINNFIIKWAIEQKIATLDFGLCRAFLNDGVFYYKRNWNMVLKDYEQNTMFFGLRVCCFNEGVQNFLENNPFVFYNNGRLEGFVFVKNKYQIEKKDICYIYKNLFTQGLTRLNLLCLLECPDEYKKIIETECQRLNLVNRGFLFNHGY
jgi:hypothetical protein